MIVAGVELELIRGGSGKSPSKSLGLALLTSALGSICTTCLTVTTLQVYYSHLSEISIIWLTLLYNRSCISQTINYLTM